MKMAKKRKAIRTKAGSRKRARTSKRHVAKRSTVRRSGKRKAARAGKTKAKVARRVVKHKTRAVKKSSNRKRKIRHIVKRHGHGEVYDERKVYASVYSACKSAQLTIRRTEEIAGEVTRAINRWIRGRETVTCHEVHGVVAHEMNKRGKSAAYMYKHHRDLS